MCKGLFLGLLGGAVTLSHVIFPAAGMAQADVSTATAIAPSALRSAGANQAPQGLGHDYLSAEDWLVAVSCAEPGALYPDTLEEAEADFAAAASFKVFVEKLTSAGGLGAKGAGAGVNFKKCFPGLQDKDMREHYAGRVVRCEKAGTYPFLVRNNGMMAVYVNGNLLNWHRKSRGDFKPGDVLTLDLKEGENFLVVRIFKRNSRPFFHLEPRQDLEMALAGVSSEWNSIFENPIIDETRALSLSFGHWTRFAKKARVSVVIRENQPVRPEASEAHKKKVVLPDDEKTGTVIRFRNIRDGRHATGARFKPGLYSLEMSLGDKTMTELFCVGDPAVPHKLLRQKLLAGESSPEAQAQLQLLDRRMGTLMDPENQKPGDPQWQLKVMHVLGQMARIDSELAAGNRSLSGIKGLSLRAFVSKIDGLSQSYRLYIPENHDMGGQGIPLVVIPPPPLQKLRPFSDSPIVAKHLKAKALCRIAEECGVALLWTGYRTPMMQSPGEIASHDEAIDDVLKHYNIDRKRMTLLGVCMGGVTAGMMAVDSPKKYAGIAFHRGYFNTGYLSALKKRYMTGGNFDYRRWLRSINPAASLMSPGADMPKIFVYHNDVIVKGHGEIRHTEEFMAGAKKAGVPVEYFFARDENRTADKYLETIEWCSRQVREDASFEPRGLVYQKHNDIGPVLRAFGAPFILVVGTGGTEEERAASRMLADGFQAGWEKWNFGRCLEMTDAETTSAILHEKNLVLVGNARQNSVWARMAEQSDAFGMPVFGEGGTVSLDRREWKGRDMLVYSVAMNPMSPGKRIVFIGMNDLKPMPVPPVENLQIEGWFDFSIWNCENEQPELVAARKYKHASGPAPATPPASP